jgi:hypothetical protein
MDPFDRGKGDRRDATAATKRGKRAAGTAAPAAVNWDHYEILDSAGVAVAKYDAIDKTAALLAHKGHFPDAALTSFTARKIEDAAAAVRPGTEKVVGFDWAGMDGHMGYLIRGVDGLGDIFAIKGTPEHKKMADTLNAFAEQFQAARAKYGKKKQS